MDIITYRKNVQRQAAESAAPPQHKPVSLDATNKTALHNTPEAAVMQQSALLADTLQMHGYKPTAENMQMLKYMLDAGIPLTKENIASMNQAYKLTQDIEKALFLFQNNIPASPKNAALLKGLAEGQVKITGQIANLLEGIVQLQDPALQDALIKVLANISHASHALKQAPAEVAYQQNAPPNKVAERILEEAQAPPVKIVPQAIPKNAAFFLPPTSAATDNADSPKPLTTAVAQALASSQAAALKLQAPTGLQALAPPPTEATAPTEPAPPTEAAARAYNNFQAESPESPGKQAAEPAAQTQAAQPAQPAQATQQSLVAPAAPAPQVPQAPQDGILPSSINRLSSETQATATAAPEPAELSDLRLSLSLPLQNSSVQNIENFLKALREILLQAQTQLTSASPNEPGLARISQDIQALVEYIDFTSQIRNQIFLEIPLLINEQEYNTALFVNRDAAKGQKNKDGSGSALIALDTAFLGHFETYVQKKGTVVRCQFRLENEEIEQLVRENIHILDEQLKDYNYILDSFTFLIGDRPFTVLDALEDEKSIYRSDTVFDAMA